MTRIRSLRIVAAVLLLWAGPVARAQFSLDSPVAVSSGLSRLFGSTAAFVARTDIQVLDTNRQETMRVPTAFSFLDGKMRMEFDMARITGRTADPKTVAAFKEIGLDRIVSIVRPDRKTVFLVFPGARSFSSTELTGADSQASEKNRPIERVTLGRESVEGHSCVKDKVTVKNSNGVTLLEATTWNATDLKDFPVQVALHAPDRTTTVLHFSQVQFTRPDAAQFEPPTGFTKFATPDELVISVYNKKSTPEKTGAAQSSNKAPSKSTAPRQ